MPKRIPVIVLLVCCAVKLFAQAPSVNHWETAVNDNDSWRYFRGTQQPNANWNNLTYSANTWLQGEGGIGYGDSDDETTINGNIASFYMRRAFTVTDTAAIAKALLDIDYDDAFIAYINGVEVARNNVGNPANYNTLAFGEHEAVMYTGGLPERYEIPKSLLTACLVQGQNLLAIQIHNTATNSTDMSALPWLSFGITDNSSDYGPTPTWFVAPFEFSSSTLPIIVLTTNGNPIVDDPRVIIDMGIIDNGHGQLNHPSDTFNNYSGKISIEFRGSSTQGFPKKQFGMSTVNADGTERNVSLLGMPEENDWILNAPYTDKTMMREFITYNAARDMGQYATRTRYVELMIDGQYQGVYILLEKIKWDKERVDIPMMDANDNSGDSLSGGYIFKVDKFTGSGGQGWSSPVTDFQGQNKGIYYQYHYPKPEDITPAQEQYLQTYVDNFEQNLNSSNYNSTTNGYRNFIDVRSFIDFFIINEITKNVDGYRLSTFLHKQAENRGGKLYAGPVWDFNITLGNADYCEGDTYTGWALDFPCDQSVIPFWWHRLQQDSNYVKQLNCRWEELRGTILNTAVLMDEIDSLATLLDVPQQRNYQIWPILGTYIWPNSYIGQTYAEEVNYFKQWLTNRLSWIDNNIATIGAPVGMPQCQSVLANDIVVSEINYHSDNSLDGDDWFELHNTTSAPINIGNWQFKDDNVGNSFTIPNGTIIPANGYLVLAQTLSLFQQKNPTVTNVIGSFTFGFGNSGDQINLFDNLNNPVVAIAFADSAGWPKAADGYGYTLELVDPNGNVNSPANWVPGCINGSPGTAYVPCNYPIVFSEINYNSSPTADAEDWVELHNTTNTPIYIGNYVFLDEKDTLPYIISGGTILPANGYLVLTKDSSMFRARFSLVNNQTQRMQGEFQFGLAGSGDACRLFDTTGKLVMSVYYDDNTPWPTTPDGGGYTLELSCATCNMSVGQNWFAGCPEGSPGYAYQPNCETGVAEDLAGGVKTYPNPFSNGFVLEFTGSAPSHATLALFDAQGKMVYDKNIQSTQGINRMELNPAGDLAPGIYLLRLQLADGSSLTRTILKQ